MAHAAPHIAPRPTPPTATSAIRFDLSGRLGKFTRTPSGGLQIPAYISRVGVQTYQDAEGRVVREFRPPSEVFDEASYRSFEGAPVTRLHPPELVNPTTWRTHVIGNVRNVRPDGNRVAADLVIEDAKAIEEIEAGELVETSAGYEAAVAPLGGVYEGESYDATQQSIRGNHVALGPAGWGRAGPSVRLRVDAAHEVIGAPERAPRSDLMSTSRMVKVDGIPYEAGSESHIHAVERLIGQLEVKAAEATKRADSAEGDLEKLRKEHDELKQRADAAESTEELDARINSRLALVDKARKVLGDAYKWAGKSDRQIMVDALKKSGHSVADDATDSWVQGAFSVSLKDAKSAKKPAADAMGEGDDEEQGSRGDSHTVSVSRVDASTPAAPKKFMPTWDEKLRR